MNESIKQVDAPRNSAGMKAPKITAVMIVRDVQGRIKVDPGFDITRLSLEHQQEIANGNVVYTRP